MTNPLPRHIATLDVLRLAAALAVVAYHYLYRGAVGEAYTSIAFQTGHILILGASIGVEHLYLGVQLFFAVSGFVIMASIRNRDALAFAVARFTRLWPMFAACLTITAIVLVFAAEPRFPVSWAQWAANLTFFGPAFGQPFVDGVYWSIVLEIVFYFWVAVAILTGVLPRYVLAFATVWLAIVVANELVLDSGLVRLGLITRYGPWFLIGILSHHIVNRGVGLWALALIVGSVFMSMHSVVVEQHEIAAKYDSTANVPAVIVLNAALLLALLAALVWRFALKPAAWLTAAGGLTYPLYLLHQNIGYIAIERLTPDLGKMLAVLAVTTGMIALAWTLDAWFDRPARRALSKAIHAVLNAVPLPFLRRPA